MDAHPTPFPGTKTQSVRSKYKKIPEEPKTKPKVALNHRQNRIFGTTQNPNVPTKTIRAPDKPALKPTHMAPKTQPKSVRNPGTPAGPESQILPISPTEPEAILTAVSPTISEKQPEAVQPAEVQQILVEDNVEKLQKQSESELPQMMMISEIAVQEISAATPLEKPKSTQTSEYTPVSVTKKSPAGNKARVKKKSVCFPESAIREKALKNSQGRETDGHPRTPVRSPFSLAKPRLSGTPYQSAEKCSHCRFDRLETSSYWLSQIRLAESVGKHSVSAAFFVLALDCKAEPYRGLRVDLKKYLGRHEHLSDKPEWKDVSRKYGLLKEESNEADSGTSGDANEMQNNEPKDQQEEVTESQSQTERS